MVLSALRPDASLLEFLAHRARGASARRLALDVLAASAALFAALWWDFSARFVVGSAAACLIAYGAWGLLDRVNSRFVIRRLPKAAGLFEVLCALSAMVGVVAAAAVLLAVWAIALGTWIS